MKRRPAFGIERINRANEADGTVADEIVDVGTRNHPTNAVRDALYERKERTNEPLAFAHGSKASRNRLRAHLRHEIAELAHFFSQRCEQRLDERLKQQRSDLRRGCVNHD